MSRGAKWDEVHLRCDGLNNFSGHGFQDKKTETLTYGRGEAQMTQAKPLKLVLLLHVIGLKPQVS